MVQRTMGNVAFKTNIASSSPKNEKCTGDHWLIGEHLASRSLSPPKWKSNILFDVKSVMNAKWAYFAAKKASEVSGSGEPYRQQKYAMNDDDAQTFATPNSPWLSFTNLRVSDGTHHGI